MVVDYRIKTYFTPQFLTSLVADWYDAYKLAYLNLTNPAVDTYPQDYQYVPGTDYSDHDLINAPVSYIEILKHFIQGSYATVIIESQSDRDFFELVPNENASLHSIVSVTNANPGILEVTNHQLQSGTNIRIVGCAGMIELNNKSFKIVSEDANHFHLHDINTLTDIDTSSYGVYTGGGVASHGGGEMMPRIKFPYRMWEINLKGKDDADFPSTPMFRGMVTRIQSLTIGDKLMTGQDKLYRWIVELRGLDAWNTRQDNGVSWWYQRANNYQGRNHLTFTTADHITWNAAISLIVAWMNQNRPTVDFPITYVYVPIAAAPYNTYLDANPTTFSDPIVETAFSSTWGSLAKLLYEMGAIEGLGKKYIPQLVGNSGNTWYIEVAEGGFDKTQAAYTDFRTHESIQQNEDVTLTIDFNMIRVMFDAAPTNEYWIKFTLEKWNGAAWVVNLVNPASGYEHIAYDSTNTHTYKDYTFEKRDAGRYKWSVDILKASNNTFAVNATGSYAATAPSYSLLGSNSETDYTQLRTFVKTRGLCRWQNPVTCPDFLAGFCPGQIGLYPDPYSGGVTALTGTLTFNTDSTTVTGSGTAFTSELIATDAIRLKVGSVYSEVASITNDTALELTAPFDDPCWSGSQSGAAVKAGAAGGNEVVNPNYGIISGELIDFANISNQGSWNTLCRLNSKRIYNCSLNTDSSIRAPKNVHLNFVDGYTTDIIGLYPEYYDPVQDENIIFRVMQQTHVLQKRRLTTEVDGYRV